MGHTKTMLKLTGKHDLGERQNRSVNAWIHKSTERYRSGHNGADSKSDGRVIPARGFESHPLRHFISARFNGLLRPPLPTAKFQPEQVASPRPTAEARWLSPGFSAVEVVCASRGHFVCKDHRKHSQNGTGFLHRPTVARLVLRERLVRPDPPSEHRLFAHIRVPGILSSGFIARTTNYLLIWSPGRSRRYRANQNE